MAVRTIIKEGKGVRYERLAASGITPGMLVALNSDNKFAPHAVAGAKAAPVTAIENEIFGKGPDVAYVADDLVLAEWLHPGMQFNALFAIGAHSIAIGDQLESAGDGTLRKVVGNSIGIATGAVVDDDDAASNGTAVYLHLDENSWFGLPSGHLESVTAGDASVHFDIGNGGPRVRVKDDDAAATGGLQVYFDEDASSPDSRFLVNNTVTGKDVFVFGSDGSAVRIKHDANAASVGVALYLDDDAANIYERLLFVSPTNVDGSYATDDLVNLTSAPNYPVAVAMEAVGTLAAATHYRVAIL